MEENKTINEIKNLSDEKANEMFMKIQSCCGDDLEASRVISYLLGLTSITQRKYYKGEYSHHIRSHAYKKLKNAAYKYKNKHISKKQYLIEFFEYYFIIKDNRKLCKCPTIV